MIVKLTLNNEQIDTILSALNRIIRLRKEAANIHTPSPRLRRIEALMQDIRDQVAASKTLPKQTPPTITLPRRNNLNAK